MHTAYVGAALGALAGLASASDLISRDTTVGSFNAAKSWSDATLFQGFASAATNGADAIELCVSVPNASVSGLIDVTVGAEFLVDPTITIDLGGLEAYFEIDITASAAVVESVELVTSGALTLSIPGLSTVQIEAALALDLILSLSAAIDISAGFYVGFPVGSFIEISVITLEVVNKAIDNLSVSALPVEVGTEVDLSAEITVDVGLRLRAELGVTADVTIPGLDIGVGADLAVWVTLFDQTMVLVETSSCPVSVAESFALSIGVAIALDVDVANVTDLSLAPTIIVTLATGEEASLCLPCANKPPGTCGCGYNGCNTSLSASTLPVDAMGVTSTITSTHVYTITSCYASVVNCPAAHTQKVITSTVDVTTTVCPVADSTEPAASSSMPAAVPVPPSTSVLIPCVTPSTTTVSPALLVQTLAPTTTITELYQVTITATTVPTPGRFAAGPSNTTSSGIVPTLPSTSAPAPLDVSLTTVSTTTLIQTTTNTLLGPTGLRSAFAASTPNGFPVTAGAAGFGAHAAAAIVLPAFVAALL